MPVDSIAATITLAAGVAELQGFLDFANHIRDIRCIKAEGQM